MPLPQDASKDVRKSMSRWLATSDGDLKDFPIAALLGFWPDGDDGGRGANAHAAQLVQHVLHSWRSTVAHDLDTFPPTTSDCLCRIRQRLCATRDAIDAIVREFDPLVEAADTARDASTELITP
jgi:hypothetical protein